MSSTLYNNATITQPPVSAAFLSLKKKANVIFKTLENHIKNRNWPRFAEALSKENRQIFGESLEKKRCGWRWKGPRESCCDFKKERSPSEETLGKMEMNLKRKEDAQEAGVVKHLDDAVDGLQGVGWDVQPVVEGQRQFDSDLLALDLQQVRERLQKDLAQNICQWLISNNLEFYFLYQVVNKCTNWI